MSPGQFHKLGLGQHACHSELALGCVHGQRQKQRGKRWRDKAVYKEPFSTKGPLCGPADLVTHLLPEFPGLLPCQVGVPPFPQG